MAFANSKRMGAYILTPTGGSIAEDESNVGQQMLKKMGWTPETGLGKNNNGIVEPVKRKALKSNTGDLARKRARFTPTSDEDRGEELPSVRATPELPHDDLVEPTNPCLDEKEIPRSSRPAASRVESEESDSDGSPTEAQVEVEEEPPRRKTPLTPPNVSSRAKRRLLDFQCALSHWLPFLLMYRL
ncbi:G patch domain-containing protein 2 [Taenia solium]|eukprot:TsM_000603400 transcript=TsM_000603400 gene=TsM_000603400